MLGTLQSALHIIINLILTATQRGKYKSIPILWTRKLNHREVRWWSWGLMQTLPGAHIHTLNYCTLLKRDIGHLHHIPNPF